MCLSFFCTFAPHYKKINISKLLDYYIYEYLSAKFEIGNDSLNNILLDNEITEEQKNRYKYLRNISLKINKLIKKFKNNCKNIWYILKNVLILWC